MIEQLKTIRCIPLESCAKCPYSVGRQTCSKAQRDFEGGRPAVPPDWCPLPALHPPLAHQPQADSIPVAAFDRLMDLCESQAQRIIELEDKQPQAEAVPSTHVMVPVEPTDEMIDAACEAVKDLYWVDFVRAYKAAIAQQKGGV